jgi:hypothetical protein
MRWDRLSRLIAHLWWELLAAEDAGVASDPRWAHLVNRSGPISLNLVFTFAQRGVHEVCLVCKSVT